MLWIFLITLFSSLFIGLPVAIAMLLSAVVMLQIMDMFDPQNIIENLMMGANNFPLMAIPFFMLTGELMKAGGISMRIVDFAMSMVGHIKGGLGYVVIISGLIFAGLSGSAVADTAALGAILIPMMVSKGYPASRSTAIICSVGIIAVVLPPSIPMIVFGVTAGVSITRLFIGGIVPAIFMTLGLWLVWWALYRHSTVDTLTKKNTASRWRAFKDAFWALLLPVIIIIGLRGGIFTPTEAGVVAAAYAAIVGVAYRGINWHTLPEVFFSTVKTTGIVMFVAAAAMVSAFAITVARIPAEIMALLSGLTENKTMMMAYIMLFLLLVGCVMDLIPAILIFVPVLIPIVKMLGIDPGYFAILMILNLSIGLITPPIGTVLYVGSRIARVSVGNISIGILPFLAVYILILAIFVIFPDIVIIPMIFFS